MKFLSDTRLYNDTPYCLDYAKRLEAKPFAESAKTPFHFYWHGDFNRKTALALKSFLATQDLERVEAWLWLDAETPDTQGKISEHLGTLVSRIQVRIYDPQVLSRGTPLDGAKDILRGANPAAHSDAFRFLALYFHGGVYCDIDTLFLRDFAPLLNDDIGQFLYRWSAEDYSSSAVMRLVQKSGMAWDLMTYCREIGSCHPRLALRHDQNTDRDILELPCGLFDPLWLHLDKREKFDAAPIGNFDEFFMRFGLEFRKKPGIEALADFFPGAFSFDWHNRWGMQIHERSYFGMFEREVESRLERKFGPLRLKRDALYASAFPASGIARPRLGGA